MRKRLFVFTLLFNLFRAHRPWRRRAHAADRRISGSALARLAGNHGTVHWALLPILSGLLLVGAWEWAVLIRLFLRLPAFTFRSWILIFTVATLLLGHHLCRWHSTMKRCTARTVVNLLIIVGEPHTHRVVVAWVQVIHEQVVIVHIVIPVVANRVELRICFELFTLVFVKGRIPCGKVFCNYRWILIMHIVKGLGILFLKGWWLLRLPDIGGEGVWSTSLRLHKLSWHWILLKSGCLSKAGRHREVRLILVFPLIEIKGLLLERLGSLELSLTEILANIILRITRRGAHVATLDAVEVSWVFHLLWYWSRQRQNILHLSEASCLDHSLSTVMHTLNAEILKTWLLLKLRTTCLVNYLAFERAVTLDSTKKIWPGIAAIVCLKFWLELLSAGKSVILPCVFHKDCFRFLNLL